MIFRRSFFITFLALSLLGGSFCAGYFFRDHFASSVNNLPLLGKVLSLLKQHGLKELPPAQELEYGMVRGLLQVYDDPYTVFVEPTQHELETNTLEGSFGGIGVRISRDDAGNVILYPYPDGPASDAGVLDGDQLLSIDRLMIEITTTTDEIQAAICGPVGQAIGIGILRPSTSEISGIFNPAGRNCFAFGDLVS